MEWKFNGHDLLSMEEGDKIRANGVRHELLANNRDKIIISTENLDNYSDNPQVKELLSKGYQLKAKLKLAGSYQLVFEK